MAPLFDPAADRNGEERERPTAGRVEIRPADSTMPLGTRSLACPDCEMPLAITSSLRWSEPVQCPFCDAVASTREFVRATGWPEVRLVARIR